MTGSLLTCLMRQACQPVLMASHRSHAQIVQPHTFAYGVHSHAHSALMLSSHSVGVVLSMAGEQAQAEQCEDVQAGGQGMAGEGTRGSQGEGPVMARETRTPSADLRCGERALEVGVVARVGGQLGTARLLRAACLLQVIRLLNHPAARVQW